MHPTVRPCARLRGDPSQNISTQAEAVNVSVTLPGKRAVADVMTDLEMRSSWILQGGPKPNDWCPYKGQKRREHHGEQAA